jgi:tetratricopeptide (TPR) repeat protein
MTLSLDDAPTLARQVLDSKAPLQMAAEGSLSLAWALKDLCYEAWSSEPPRAVRAAQAVRNLFVAGVPAVQARQIEALADWTWGIALILGGKMAEAVIFFDLAQSGFRHTGLADAAAQTQVPKIIALSMLGQHDQATQCAEAAQKELLAVGNVRAAARVSQNLGGLHLHRDAYAQAAMHYRQAAVLFARLGEHEQSVLADIGMADAHTAMGELDEALRIYARARMRAGNQKLDMALALVDESVALVDLVRGHYREALSGMESARRRYETLALPQHLAIAEKQLADTYLELHLLPEALALFDLSVAKFKNLDLPDEQAWALSQRGCTQALLGQAAADDSFSSAADLFDRQGNQVGMSAVALARAELALAGPKPLAALTWADQAIGGFGEAGHASGGAQAHVIRAFALLNAGQIAQASVAFDVAYALALSMQLLTIQVRCLTGQGLVALALNDSVAAETSFEAAIELFEHQRRALPSDEMRRAFLTDHLRPYQERLRLDLARGVASETLVQMERVRARAFDERLSEGLLPDADSDADTQTLRERLNWLYRRDQLQQDEAEVSGILREELLRTERDLLERTRRQRLTLASRVAPQTSDFSVAALQAGLKPGDALVEYGALDDELFACVVTCDGVSLKRHLASWSHVQGAVRSARFQIDTLRHGSAPVLRHMGTLAERMQARMKQLYRLIWAPLESQLLGCQRVVVVPHAQLGAVPFAALTDGQMSLGERFEMAMAPSARVAMRGLGRLAVRPRKIVALAESTGLPHTAGEAACVAALFEQGHAYIGVEATLEALRCHAHDADVLHLACHAQFRSDNPRFSALHLHDGALTVEMAEALPLQACIVVLSACETGLAEVSTGDEMIGLVRAFLVAGAARVLASQWPVDDAVTASFMSQFYGALVRGLSPTQALGHAQAVIKRTHPHPYFWAAFTLYGGW